jgi:hypothetical protein
MNAAPSDLGATAHRRSPRWLWLAVPTLLVVVVTMVGAQVVFHGVEGRTVPTFVSLAEHPDASLQGTVAYTTADRCIRIVAAAGQPSKDVLCLGPLQLDPAKVVVAGKEMVAPQLVWRPDGRLEVTGFRVNVGPETAGKAPVYTAGWQKIVDVRTGTIEDVPAADLPSAPNLTTRPTVSPSGQRLSSTSNGQTGQVKVTLTDQAGTRTLLSAHGPGEYGYFLYSVFWAPHWQWVAVDDGRILITTTGALPVTRVLVDGSGDWGAFPTFAVSTQNVLSSGGLA